MQVVCVEADIIVVENLDNSTVDEEEEERCPAAHEHNQDHNDEHSLQHDQGYHNDKHGHEHIQDQGKKRRQLIAQHKICYKRPLRARNISFHLKGWNDQKVLSHKSKNW